MRFLLIIVVLWSIFSGNSKAAEIDVEKARMCYQVAIYAGVVVDAKARGLLLSEIFTILESRPEKVAGTSFALKEIATAAYNTSLSKEDLQDFTFNYCILK